MLRQGASSTEDDDPGSPIDAIVGEIDEWWPMDGPPVGRPSTIHRMLPHTPQFNAIRDSIAGAQPVSRASRAKLQQPQENEEAGSDEENLFPTSPLARIREVCKEAVAGLYRPTPSATASPSAAQLLAPTSAVGCASAADSMQQAAMSSLLGAMAESSDGTGETALAPMLTADHPGAAAPANASAPARRIAPLVPTRKRRASQAGAGPTPAGSAEASAAKAARETPGLPRSLLRPRRDAATGASADDPMQTAAAASSSLNAMAESAEVEEAALAPAHAAVRPADALAETAACDDEVAADEAADEGADEARDETCDEARDEACDEACDKVPRVAPLAQTRKRRGRCDQTSHSRPTTTGAREVDEHADEGLEAELPRSLLRPRRHAPAPEPAAVQAAAARALVAPQLAPLPSVPAMGAMVVVLASDWPACPCSEYSGVGWEAEVLSATQKSAVVRYVHAATADGRPFLDQRIALKSLRTVA